MDWKKSLDLYLTQEPDWYFEYNNFYEHVVDSFSDEFYNENENWIVDSEQMDKWVSKLYDKSIFSPKECSIIIERAFKLYIS